MKSCISDGEGQTYGNREPTGERERTGRSSGPVDNPRMYLWMFKLAAYLILALKSWP